MPPKKPPNDPLPTTSAKHKVPTSTYSEQFAVLETYIIIPPDGGWGWVTVVVAFLCNFVADGTMYTFGIFLEDISLAVDVPKESVAVANSLMTGSYYLTAPIVSALTNRYGYRVVAIFGGIISSISIFVTSYAQRVLTVLIVYGVIGGLGFGMMYLPSLIVLGYYFERWRALANSIASTGSSLGIICFPLLFSILLKDEDWRLKFRIISSIALFCAFLTILYRPLLPVKIVNTDDKHVQFLNDYRSLTSVVGATDSFIKPSFSQFHNVTYPTTADFHSGGTGGTGIGNYSTSNVSMLVGTSGPSTSFSRFSVNKSRSAFKQNRLRTVMEEDEDYEEFSRCTRCCTLCCMRFGDMCKSCWCCCCQAKEDTIPGRPLYRDDIFYNASVARLPEYIRTTQSRTSRIIMNEPSKLDYHLSVTRVATARDMEETYEVCICCPEAIKRTLATMLDVSLLKSPSFLILSISGLISSLGLYTPFMFIAERAMDNGIEAEVAYSLITTLGIANSVGRMGSGILSSLPSVNALLISYVSLTICGVATLLSSISFSVPYQMGYACVFASTIACVASLRAVIVVEMVGLDQLTNGFGLNLMFQGFACLAGVPLAGILKTRYGSYDVAFYFSGTTILISAILLMPIEAIHKWEKRHSAQTYSL